MAVELTLPTISPQAMTLESVGPITLVLGSVISIAPTITTNPTISGTAKVGETLTATAGDTTGTPPPTSTLQWQRSDNGTSGWSDISGATGTTYVLVSADESKYLRVEQTATNIEGSATATSASTSQVQPAFTGLLDTYSGAAAAYSLRLLRGDYEGNCIRVRRLDDNAEQNIGFRNNELDTSALTTFCGSSDGFVVTWFDQSDNETPNNLTQSTASSQPKIVSEGSVILEEEKPTLEFDGINDFMLSDSISSNQPISFFHLRRYRTTDQVKNALTLSNDTGFAWGDYFDGGKLRAYFGSTGSTSAGYNTNRNLWSVIANGSNSTISLNGSSTEESLGNSNIDQISLGRRGAPIQGVNAAINCQELVLYLSDVGTTNFEGIETNINDHYSIYE